MDQPHHSPDFPGCSLCGQDWIQAELLGRWEQGMAVHLGWSRAPARSLLLAAGPWNPRKLLGLSLSFVCSLLE